MDLRGGCTERHVLMNPVVIRKERQQRVVADRLLKLEVNVVAPLPGVVEIAVAAYVIVADDRTRITQLLQVAGVELRAGEPGVPAAIRTEHRKRRRERRLDR